MKHRRTLAVTVAGCLLALAARAQTGALRVVSQPGVTVVWEDVELGATSADGALLIEGIPLGTYNLTLTRSGYRPLTSRVEITSGKTTVSLLLTSARPAAGELPGAPASLSPGDETAPPIETPPANPPEPSAIDRPAAAGTATAANVDSPAPPPAAAAPPETAATGELTRRPLSALSPLSPLPLLAVLAAALAGLGWWLWRRRLDRRTELAAAPAPSEAWAATERASDDESEAEQEVASIFRERLRQREAKLDRGDAAPRLEPDERIIDVVDFEVLEEPP